MRLRIIIDDQDRTDAPDRPFTLTAFEDNDDGTPSQEFVQFGTEEAIIGSDVRAMLREAAHTMKIDQP